MIDVFNFKRKSYHLDDTSSSLTVAIPFGNAAYRAVINDYKTKEEAYKMLTYVVNIAHYGSPSNIIGLTGKERRLDVCRNLGLPLTFKESNKIKIAIAKYNEHYNKGVFGLFKELNISYEMTRSSIEILNMSLKDLVKDIRNQQRAKTASPDVMLGKIKDINSAISQVRELTTSLSKDVEQLRSIEDLMLSEEAVQIELYGGGYVPESAKVLN